MYTSRNGTIRTFWADVLARATTDELAQMVETLAARRASEGSQADSDLLVLARGLLERRHASGSPRG
jgi:hypothetical protein